MLNAVYIYERSIETHTQMKKYPFNIQNYPLQQNYETYKINVVQGKLS